MADGEGMACKSGGAMHNERGTGAVREARQSVSGMVAGEAQRRWWLGLERWQHDIQREKDGHSQKKRKRVGPHVSVKF